MTANRSSRPDSDSPANGGVHGDGGNRTRAVFPPLPGDLHHFDSAELDELLSELSRDFAGAHLNAGVVISAVRVRLRELIQKRDHKPPGADAWQGAERLSGIPEAGRPPHDSPARTGGAGGTLRDGRIACPAPG